MFLKVHESDNINPEECAFREPTPKSHSRELLCFLTKVWSSLDSESFMPLLGVRSQAPTIALKAQWNWPPLRTMPAVF